MRFQILLVTTSFPTISRVSPGVKTETDFPLGKHYFKDNMGQLCQKLSLVHDYWSCRHKMLPADELIPFSFFYNFTNMLRGCGPLSFSMVFLGVSVSNTNSMEPESCFGVTFSVDITGFIVLV